MPIRSRRNWWRQKCGIRDLRRLCELPCSQEFLLQLPGGWSAFAGIFLERSGQHRTQGLRPSGYPLSLQTTEDHEHDEHQQQVVARERFGLRRRGHGHCGPGARKHQGTGGYAQATGRYVSEQPVRSALIAAAVGAAVAALVLAMRRNRRYYD